MNNFYITKIFFLYIIMICIMYLKLFIFLINILGTLILYLKQNFITKGFIDQLKYLHISEVIHKFWTIIYNLSDLILIQN